VIPLFDSNPVSRRPIGTQALIAANLLVFVATLYLENHGVSYLSAGYGLVPRRLSLDLAGEWFTVLTSMFLHAGLAHVGWNMLFLFIFGDNVEDHLGTSRFLLFYLLGGVGAALGQYAMDPFSAVPMVGASGAIGAVLGGYLVLYPRAPIHILNPIPIFWPFGLTWAIPAWFVVGEWFIGNLVGTVSARPGSGGVAFAAHLGGFLVGLLTVRLFARFGSTPAGRSAEWAARSRPERAIFWRDEPGRPFWR
jgi:membrane associated rhomboid family serine protease